MSTPVPVSPPQPRGYFRLVSLLAIALLIAPALARAQDSGQQEQPQQDQSQQDQGGLGLDLSAPAPEENTPPPANAGPELRPSLAVVGISAEDEGDADFANAVAGALVPSGKAKRRFNPLLSPDKVRDALGAGYADALKCAEAACLETLAATADAERVVVGHLSHDGKRRKLTLQAYARGTPGVETAEVEGSGKSDLARKARAALGPMLEKLSTPLAMLKVTTNLSGATVTLDDRELGSGSLEKPVPAGQRTLKVAAPEYATFEAPVTLEPGKSLEIDAPLKELPSAPAPKPDKVAEALKQPAPKPVAAAAPLWKRPQPYMVAAGIVMAAVGVGLGVSAQSVAAKAVPGDDGLLGVTRSQLLAAQSSAAWANGLVAGGAALAVGGAVWFFLTPNPSLTPSPSSSPAGEPAPVSSGRAPLGLGLVATGSF